MVGVAGALYPRGTGKYLRGAVWQNIGPKFDRDTGSRPRETTKLGGNFLGGGALTPKIILDLQTFLKIILVK